MSGNLLRYLIHNLIVVYYSTSVSDLRQNLQASSWHLPGYMADDGAPSHHCYCVWVLFITTIFSYTAVPLLHSHPRGFCGRGTSDTALLWLHRSLPTRFSHIHYWKRSVAMWLVWCHSQSANLNPPNTIHSFLEPIRQIKFLPNCPAIQYMSCLPHTSHISIQRPKYSLSVKSVVKTLFKQLTLSYKHLP